MGDKSPRSHMTTKSKSIKEKRADKHAKADQKDHTEIIAAQGQALTPIERRGSGSAQPSSACIRRTQAGSVP